jgi:hypothetical protein
MHGVNQIVKFPGFFFSKFSLTFLFIYLDNLPINVSPELYFDSSYLTNNK